MEQYSFYLFTQLVNDIVIDLNDWSIPYDVSFLIVLKSFQDFTMQDDGEGSTYVAMVDWINDDEELYSSLRGCTE